MYNIILNYNNNKSQLKKMYDQCESFFKTIKYLTFSRKK